MIVVSDNAATDLALDALGGPHVVTAAMQELGLTEIRLDRTIKALLADISAAIDPRTQGLDYHALEKLFAETPEDQ